jgi:hypothetical protein
MKSPFYAWAREQIFFRVDLCGAMLAEGFRQGSAQEFKCNFFAKDRKVDIPGYYRVDLRKRRL